MDLARPLRCLALGFLLVACLSCEKRSQAPRPAPDLSFLPAGFLFVAYADTVRLQESSLYREWDSQDSSGREGLVEARTFLRRLHLDPEKDIEGLMVAYRPAPGGGEWLALLRGRFERDRVEQELEDPSSRMSVEQIGRWNIYSLAPVPQLGDLSLVVVEPGAVALGKAETLRKVLETRDHRDSSLAAHATLKRMVSRVDPEAQAWAVLDGRALSRVMAEGQGSLPQGMDTPSLGNLSSIVAASLSASLGADLSLRLEIGTDSPQRARSLSDTLKGILGFSRLGFAAREPDVERMVDSMRVSEEGEKVFVRLDLPGDFVKRLAARIRQGDTGKEEATR